MNLTSVCKWKGKHVSLRALGKKQEFPYSQSSSLLCLHLLVSSVTISLECFINALFWPKSICWPQTDPYVLWVWDDILRQAHRFTVWCSELALLWQQHLPLLQAEKSILCRVDWVPGPSPLLGLTQSREQGAFMGDHRCLYTKWQFSSSIIPCYCITRSYHEASISFLRF